MTSAFESLKKIAIFGYGLEGKSILDFLLKKNAAGENIFIFDEKDLSVEDRDYLKGKRVNLAVSDFEKNNYRGFELAFRSPGVKRERLEKILGGGIKISTATNLFFENSKGKIIAVTGTKGKSTTVKLIEAALKISGLEVFVGGNIGYPPLTFVDELNEKSFCVLELSSFQLDDLNYSPKIAVILPILIDHLDYHSSEREYLQAKSKIVSKMTKDDFAICANQGNARLVAENSSLSKKLFFSEDKMDRAGCYYQGNSLFCKDNQKQKEFSDALSYSKKYKIPRINLAAALTFAFSQNLEVDLGHLFQIFEKPSLRIELVGEIKGLVFYNDSASTNPISTIAAMSTMEGPYILILGGSSKNLKFSQLAQEASKDQNLRKIYLFGETKEEIKTALSQAGFQNEMKEKEKIEEIISDIFANSVDFKAVLFSPACASFDQFKNYKDRGEQFNKLVQQYQE